MSNATPGSGQPNSRNDEEEMEAITQAVIVQVNVFVLGMIGLFMLVRLPQLFALLSSRMPRPFFQFLTRGAKGNSEQPPPARRLTKKQYEYKNPWDTVNETASIRGPTLRSGQKRNSSFNPPHVPSVPLLLAPLMNLLRLSIAPGYSVGQAAVMLNYFYVLLYGTFRESNVFTDNIRSAFMATSQIPLVFALAQKNNLIGGLLGYGYEKVSSAWIMACTRPHPLIAQLCSPIRWKSRRDRIQHSCSLLQYVFPRSPEIDYLSPLKVSRWAQAGTFIRNVSRLNNASGFAAILAMDMMCIFSLSFFRNRSYNVFRVTHTIGIFTILPGVCSIYLSMPKKKA